MRFYPKSVLVVIAVATAGALAWVVQPTSFVSDDSYFYLVIARNLSLHGHQTFSGVTDTNGFQPLWGYALALYSLGVGRIRPGFLWNVRYALPLEVGILALAVWVWLRLSAVLKLNPALVAGLPIAFVCCFGVLFSEAEVEVLLIGLIATRLVSPHSRSAYWWATTGMLAGLVVLARIDLAVFGVAAIIVILVQARPYWYNAIVCVGSFTVLVGAYLIYNQVHFGYPLPMSGFLKSTFPRVNVRPLEISGLETTVAGINVVFGILTLAFAAIVLLLLRRHRARPLLFAMFVGAAGQAVEVGLFGRGPTSWYWYYVLPVAMAGIAAGALAERSEFLERAAPLAVIFVAIGALVVGLHTQQKVNVNQAAGIRIAQSLRLSSRQTLIVSDWPGEIAFDTRTNVFATDLLTANYRFYKSMTSSRNALIFVVQKAKAAGSPVRALIVFRGSSKASIQTLRIQQNASAVTYFDPVQPDKPIGWLRLGVPVESDRDVAVWLLPSSV